MENPKRKPSTYLICKYIMVIDYLYRKKEKEKLEGKMGEYLISTLENAFLSTKF